MAGQTGQAKENEEEKQEEQDIMQWLTRRQPPRMRDIHWEHTPTLLIGTAIHWRTVFVHPSHTNTS